MPATDDPNIDLAFDWYEPRPNDPVGLVLLPIAEPCDAAAYLSFFGAEGDGRHEGLVRLMRDWQQRYGAQLVASWGTMLQFAVTSPPQTLEDAHALALQHVTVAPCTTVMPGVAVRDLAHDLRRSGGWFLHERP